MSDTPVQLNLSRHQYRTLKYINDHEVTLAHLRKAHAVTLGSLAYRGYLRRLGAGEGAAVVLTDAGFEAMKAYQEDGMNERMREGDLTERCQRLLQHSRRVAVIGKSA